jgi:hypothetical protein
MNSGSTGGGWFYAGKGHEWLERLLEAVIELAQTGTARLKASQPTPAEEAQRATVAAGQMLDLARQRFLELDAWCEAQQQSRVTTTLSMVRARIAEALNSLGG